MTMTKRLCALLVMSMLAVLMLTAPAPAAADGEISALFLNVGKADAALFFLDQKRFLIDTGSKDSYDQLVRVLEAYEIDRLDGVLITHTDKDHVGGLKKLLKGGLTVDALYAGALHGETGDHPVEEAASKYEVPLTWLSAGDEIDLGNGCVFHVLGPLEKDPENENNNSLVLRLSTPEGDMLLTGDMELAEEAALLSQGLIAPAPVLKVAHHGEDDATGRAFALLAKPQWAIISTSTLEEPDTPDSQIVSRLWDVNASVAVTQDAEVGILIRLSNGEATAEQIDWQ